MSKNNTIYSTPEKLTHQYYFQNYKINENIENIINEILKYFQSGETAPKYMYFIFPLL